MSSLTKSTRARLWIIGGVAVVVVAAAGAVALFGATPEAQAEQPIAFNHVIHVQQNGISCVYCHNGVMRSPSANIPSMQICAGCHAERYGGIDNGSEALARLREYIASGEPIEWERVTYLPRYAYFAHHVHIKAGVACETCHGDVAGMAEVYQAERINMGWCLRCHQREENALELMDCSVCHR